MTTGHDLTTKVIRERKRPKPTSTNAKITRAPFGDSARKDLPIPAFIDGYNHYMGAVDRANQLRKYFTIHFPRNEKEFFPGLFWCIDMVVTNSYKIHCHINKLKNHRTGRPKPEAHREFIEDLTNLLFLQQIKEFAETITTKPYPRFVRNQPKSGRLISLPTLPNIGMIQTFNHTHIKRDKYDYCQVCREEVIKQKKKALDRQPKQLKSHDFNLIGPNLIENLYRSQRAKRARGRSTLWYCQDCKFPICKEGQCWQIAHNLIES